MFPLLDRRSVILTEVQLPSVKNINGNLSIVIINSAIASNRKNVNQ